MFPVLPRIEIEPLYGFNIFGVCLAVAITGGIVATLTLARLRDLDVAELKGFIVAVLVPGFILAHVGDAVLYHWEAVVERPIMLLDVRSSLSSFCGFTGAVGGAAWFHRRRRSVSLAQHIELLLLVFPVSWLFGRLGCSLIHDHVGIVVDAGTAFAVGFGDGPVTRWGPVGLVHGATPRLDLGLIELVCCIPIAGWCVSRWRSAPLDGVTTSALCLVYGPLRVVLDGLRAGADVVGGDVRVAGLSWGQWAGIALCGVGVTLTVRRRRRARPGRG